MQFFSSRIIYFPTVWDFKGARFKAKDWAWFVIDVESGHYSDISVILKDWKHWTDRYAITPRLL